MSEPEMMDLYTKWAAEKIDPLREENAGLRSENALMRDMILQLVTAYDETSASEIIGGLDAEIEALRDWLRNTQ
jgi:hypothetical protein